MSAPRRTPPKLPTPPRWMLYTVILFVVISWIPLAIIARSRAIKSDEPRVHLWLDMDNQPRYEAQAPHPLYADRRAMRPPVPGAVPRTRGGATIKAFGSDFYHLGYATEGGEPVMPTRTVNGNEVQSVQWYDGYPEAVEVDRELLERGRERFNIYCAVCHGAAGYGDGMVARRAAELSVEGAAPGWVPPVNLHAVNPSTGGLLYGGPDYPTGKLFNAISNGIRTMPAYDKQISVEDRWAIVAYVKALQFSQHVPAEAVPEDLVGQLRPPQPADQEESGEGGGGPAQQGPNQQAGGAAAQPGAANQGAAASQPQPQQPQQPHPPTPNRGD